MFKNGSFWVLFLFIEVHNIVIDELFSNTLHQEDLIESFKCPMENLSPGKRFLIVVADLLIILKYVC